MAINGFNRFTTKAFLFFIGLLISVNTVIAKGGQWVPPIPSIDPIIKHVNLAAVEDTQLDFTYIQLGISPSEYGISIQSSPIHGSLSTSSTMHGLAYKAYQNYCGGDTFIIKTKQDGYGDNITPIKPPIAGLNAAPTPAFLKQVIYFEYRVSVNVSCRNDRPTVGSIGNKVINEDSNTGNIYFSVNDIETPAGNLSLSRSTNNANLVPYSNIVLGGSGASRYVKVTPAPNQYGSALITVHVSDGQLSSSRSFWVTVKNVNDRPTISSLPHKTINEDSNTGNIIFTISDIDTPVSSLILSRSSSNQTLVPTGNISLGGTGQYRYVKVTPAPNQYGNALITVNVSDGALSASRQFWVTVNAINDRPTISGISSRTMNEDSNTGTIGFTVGDIDTSVNSLTLSRSSNNQSLVPNGNISVWGTGANRYVKVTPKANQSGSALITVNVSDGALLASRQFWVTVKPINDRPTIGGISNRTINEDSNTGTIGFTVGDIDTSVNSLTLSRTSSNQSLVPNGNISVWGAGANRYIKVTPKANQSGVADITVTVSDGSLTASRQFRLTVNAINDRPTIGAIGNQSINEDSSTGNISFNVADIDTSVNSLTLSRTSSNQSLVPTGNISVWGTGANRYVKVTPKANQSGSTNVTVTVSDGQLSASRTFAVNVNAVDDAPIVNLSAPNSITDRQNLSVSANASDIDSSIQQVEFKLNNSSWQSDTTAPYQYSFSNLSAGQYTVYARAKSNNRYSDVQARTVTVSLTAPNKPTAINLPSSVAEPEFDISWNQTAKATQYQLQSALDGGAWQSVTSTSATSYHASISDFGEYQYRVRACNSTGCSDWTLSNKLYVNFDDGINITETTVPDALGSNQVPTQAVNIDAAQLKGNGGVSGGQASYNIPIQLAPGRGGIQPKVSLSYNSQSGNGIAGMGWSLNAGSSISRCSANYAQDGFTRAVTFNAETDRLCFNGQRLIAISGAYGQSGTEYRTEMDSFVKVIQQGEINSNQSHFTVYRADGSEASYGSDTQSRFAPSGLSTPLSWKVTQERYSGGANTINYHYDTSVAGEHLLKNIHYTGSQTAEGDRKIELIYEAREDKRSGYLAGGKTVTTRRLSEINTYHLSSKVHSYQLSYDYSGASQRSLLSSVIQCGYTDSGSQQCLPATDFDWQQQLSHTLEPFNFGEGMAYPEAKEIHQVMPRGDSNGDGVADWLGQYVNAEGQKTGENPFQLDPCYLNRLSLKPICVNGDINQDGKTDDWQNVNNQLIIQYTDGARINTGIILQPSSVTGLQDSHPVHLADYNGDGWVDLMLYDNNSHNPLLKLFLHTKQTHSPYQQGQVVFHYQRTSAANNTAHFLITDVQFMGDMTGDGLPDLIINETGADVKNGYPQPRPITLLINQMTTGLWNNFSHQSLDFIVAGTSSYFSYFIDVNADGLQDWIGWNDDRQVDDSLILRLNKGLGNFSQSLPIDGDTLASRITYYYHSEREPDIRRVPKYHNAFKVYDINFDGQPELLTPGTRVIEGCALVSTVYPRYNQSMRCGDALYGNYYATNAISSRTSINSAEADDSIYQFDVIHFDENEDGSISLRREPTDYYGHAYESRVVDAYGTGLPSLLFVHRKRDYTEHNGDASGTPFAGFGQQYGVYYNRNFGAGSGQTPSDYQPVDYLQAVTDGAGNQSRWHYRPLSSGIASAGQDKLYHTDHEYVGDGYIHFGSSMYVVNAFDSPNGQGGHNQTQYAYKGAMYHLQGRGFTGFREIIEQEQGRNKIVSSRFHQKFPEVGLIEQQQVHVGSQLISQTQYTWQDNPNHQVSGVKHNVLTQQVQTRWDLNGKMLSTSTQAVNANDVDEFGNIKRSTTTLVDEVEGGQLSYQTQVDTAFAPDENNWWLRRYDRKTSTISPVVRSWGGNLAGFDQSTQQVQVVDEWDVTHHKPKQVTSFGTHNGINSCQRTEINLYNDYGLPYRSTVMGETPTNGSCSTMNSRVTQITYTRTGDSTQADGYLPFTVTNSLNHQVTTHYDMGLGLPIKITDANHRITETEYDVLGRPVLVKQTGQPHQYLRYLKASHSNHNPAYGQWLTQVSSAGMPTSLAFIDSLGRPVRSATQGFDGRYQYQDKHYDSLGRLIKDSQVYYAGDITQYTEFGGFDALDRPAWRRLPNGYNGGLLSQYEYDGLTTHISVAGLGMSRTYGSQGWLYQTTDAMGGTNRFGYDGAGRPLVIEDANGNQIKAQYNGLGHKTKVIDPNQGSTEFTYNSLGELTYQKDANGVSQALTLDTLGRITRKTITGGHDAGVSVYRWDTDKKGLLSQEEGNGIRRSYQYNAALQVTQSSVQVSNAVGGDNQTRTVKHQYDSFYGRPKGLVYPNGLTLAYQYNETGYMTHTRNAASGYTYQRITAMDAQGHITGAGLANSRMQQVNGYHDAGMMASTKTTAQTGTLHHHAYEQYDAFMNLTQEINYQTGLEKSYGYDDLHRLTDYDFASQAFLGRAGFNGSVDYAYDAVGNLLKKSDYSQNHQNAYRYGNQCNSSKPNAVCQIDKLNGATVSFGYDQRGNLTSGDGLTMTYSTLDKPLSVIGRGASSHFVYGSDNMRALQTRTVSNKTVNTHYVDKFYEADNDGSWRAFIGDIAVLSYTPERKHQLLYTLRDRLGSATTLVNQHAQIVSRRYFDPFGRTTNVGADHHIDMLNGNVALSKLIDLSDTNQYRRGFTDHEHLNEQQLIHMNGRVYDYNLGRFMSVDPLIQSPTSTQSVNPYSYIMNNPLAGTDPTGYCSTGTRIKGRSAADCRLAYDSGDLLKQAKSKGGDVSVKSNGNTSVQPSKNVDFEIDKIGSTETISQDDGTRLGGEGGGNNNQARTSHKEKGFYGEPLTRIPSTLHAPAGEENIDRIEEEIIDSWSLDLIIGKNWRSAFSSGADLPDVRDVLSGHSIVDGQTIRGGSPVSFGMELHVDFHEFDVKIEQFRRVRVRGKISTFRTHHKALSPSGEVMRFDGKPLVIDNTIRTPLKGTYFRYKSSTGQKLGTQKWPTPLSRKLPLR